MSFYELSIYAGCLTAAGLVGYGLWLLFGRGPRRQRAYTRAHRLLKEGAWQQALAAVESWKGKSRKPLWQGRWRNLEGECHHAASAAARADKRFEDALQHTLTALQLLPLNPAEERQRVIESGLAEVRRLFVAGKDGTEATQQLIGRLLRIQSPCAEASFWQALCHVRERRPDLAVAALRTAHEAGGRAFLDPPLYLGALLLREGQAPEAVRLLSEANRIGSSSPFVTWQLGMGMVATGGDAGIATRALQRAIKTFAEVRAQAGGTQRAWVEALPEGKSFVRRLAAEHPFTCPVFGGDFAAMTRQAQFALAQALYAQGNFQGAADQYHALLQESPPSGPLLRGLGCSLARLERYDQAYKHLRTAWDQEEPKTYLTSGYLALCGALGKPSQAEDKPKNITWAIRLLARFNLTGNAEWAQIYSAIFAEARAIDLPLAVEDQVRLCDVLASVHAADPAAAAAYDQLAATSLEAVRPEYAWLYCRAAQQHQYAGSCDRALFGLAFRDADAAAAYFAERQWDFEAVESTFLERCAAREPGRFPEEFGPDYPARGEAMLLDRSRRLEQAGQKDAALHSAELLLRLAPRSVPAHDRLAYLHFQRGDLERSAALLCAWHELEPRNHWPLVRGAVVEQRRGNLDGAAEAIDRAMDLTRGALRAAIAFLGARLTLAHYSAEVQLTPPDWGLTQRFLQECLKEDADHIDAVCCLAAVRRTTGDEAGLAAMSPAMHRPGVVDARFHYLAAVCHLAAREPKLATEAAHRAVEQARGGALPFGHFIEECHYLAGWAQLQRGDSAAALAAFQRVAHAPGSPAADHARAVLGLLCFDRGVYEEAIQWWTAVEPQKRAAWGVDAALASTQFLAGLQAHEIGMYELAADRFRVAGRLGLRDPRLGGLLNLALVQAAKQLLYGTRPQSARTAASENRVAHRAAAKSPV
jgi:tetratricopeptide (TPR) repeat protein